MGLGGHVDGARARQLIVAQAKAGNPYSNIKLAIIQDAGTLGFNADSKQAAATALPYLPTVRAAAERGDPHAQYLWGTVLLRGIAVAKQPAEAAVWLHKAAEHGEIWAMFNLGYMARSGDGAAKDHAEAVRWFSRAAEAGNAAAMTELAHLGLEGAAEVRGPAEGAAWLEKAAERGEPAAVSWWAARLLYGVEGVAAQPERARAWLEKAAALDDSRGLYNLGAALLIGAGGAPDEKRAVGLFERIAARGNTYAMLQLMWQHALGRGTPRDVAKAGDWIERAAASNSDDFDRILGTEPDQPASARAYFQQGVAQLDQLAAGGDAFAGGLLSRLYYMGIGVEQDVTRALALARRAAAAGSTEAMRTLGWAYRKGNGVEADAEQAAAWWRRGAEHGNSFCMMWYSQMLFRGEAGTVDKAEALAWLERSAGRGNAWAVLDLAHLYDEGWYEMPRDERKAAAWMRKAAVAFGSTDALGWLRSHGLEP